jgi:hypothetical protein
MSGREERYITRPLNWLRQGRWADEPVKPVTATIDANGIQVRPPDQQQRQSVDRHAMAAEAAARALEEQERRQ